MDVRRLPAEPGGQAQLSVHGEEPRSPRRVLPHGRRRARPDVVAGAPAGAGRSTRARRSRRSSCSSRRRTPRPPTRPCPSASARSRRSTPADRRSRRATSRSAGCSTCRRRSPPSPPAAGGPGGTRSPTRTGATRRRTCGSRSATRTRSSASGWSPSRSRCPSAARRRPACAVRPRNPFMRGQPVHRPFQVVGESAGAVPPPGVPRSRPPARACPIPGRPALDGGIQHLPILSKGVIVLAGLLVAAIAGLVSPGEDGRRVGRPDPGRGAPQPPTGADRRGRHGGSHPAALGAERPRRALPGPAGRRDDRRRLGIDDVPGGATSSTRRSSSRGRARATGRRGAGGHSRRARRRSSARSRATIGCRRRRTSRRRGPGGPTVSWTDNDQNDHTVLVDGAPVGQAAPAGVKNVTVPLPAGRHCVTVVGRRGQTLSSPQSAPPQCVESTGPPSSAATAPPESGVRAVPQADRGAGRAVLPRLADAAGRAADQRRHRRHRGNRPARPPRRAPHPAGSDRSWPWSARLTRSRAWPTPCCSGQGGGPAAQLVPVTQLPQLRFVTGFVIVVPNFATLQQAQQFLRRRPVRASPRAARPSRPPRSDTSRPAVMRVPGCAPRWCAPRWGAPASARVGTHRPAKHRTFRHSAPVPSRCIRGPVRADSRVRP